MIEEALGANIWEEYTMAAHRGPLLEAIVMLLMTNLKDKI